LKELPHERSEIYDEYSLQVIGKIKSSFKEKFAVPRQSGLTPSAVGEIEFFPPYNQTAAFDGLEAYSHIWLQFVFHQNLTIEWRPKVRPPRLGGNKKVGVFATRSPVRPNPIGLSVVELKEVKVSGNVASLIVAGADLVHGTPILDVKPYIPYADSLPNAEASFADSKPKTVPVEFNSGIKPTLDHAKKLFPTIETLIVEVLSQDPRPQYQTPDEKRVYGAHIEQWNVCWRYIVENNSDNGWKIEVVSLEELGEG
jgi:tRNA-Thr(GGU) m(6)t(6)A37 methyltransferase TsaA